MVLGTRGARPRTWLGVALVLAGCAGKSIEQRQGPSGESGAMADGGTVNAERGGTSAGGTLGAVGGSAAGGGAGRSPSELGGAPASGGAGSGRLTGGSSGKGGDAAQGGQDGAGDGGLSTGGGTAGRPGAAGHAGAGGASGASGRGGGAGKGGAAGKGGSGGELGAPLFSYACDTDSQCSTGLTCFKSAPGNGEGPAHGLCTRPCDADADCTELSAGSSCVAFGSGNHCVSGCATGTLAVPKCEERTDLACSLAGLVPTGLVCKSSTECHAGQLCDASTGVCADPILACLPTCGGDYDCGDGRYCDFATGLCSDTAPDGLPLGSLCDPGADACAGFCVSSESGQDGTCSAFCSLNRELTGCGWDGSGVADTACLFATLLSGDDVGVGDVGICGKLCDCNADCPAEGDYCVDDSSGTVLAIWGRNGYCRPLQSGESTIDTFRVCASARVAGAR